MAFTFLLWGGRMADRHALPLTRRYAWHCIWLAIVAACPGAVGAAVVVVPAARDNTLYESAAGDMSAGQGTGLYVGRNNQDEHFRRRGLVAFDIAAVIPPDALIATATLSLAVTRVSSAGGDQLVAHVSLHRLLRDWGEAGSSAGQSSGGGSPAQPGDATWNAAHFPNELWNTPGGDFSPTASASVDLLKVGQYEVASTPELVADIQAWLTDPTTNFGWLLRTSELAPGSAKVLASREYSDTEFRPRLMIEYSLPTPGDTDGDGDVDLEDLNNVRNHFGETGLSLQGDTAPFDGDVDLEDLNAVRNHFGAGATSNVPEPATGALAGLAVVFILATRALLQHRARIKPGLPLSLDPGAGFLRSPEAGLVDA